jgi:hypothetical protein
VLRALDSARSLPDSDWAIRELLRICLQLCWVKVITRPYFRRLGTRIYRQLKILELSIGDEVKLVELVFRVLSLLSMFTSEMDLAANDFSWFSHLQIMLLGKLEAETALIFCCNSE